MQRTQHNQVLFFKTKYLDLNLNFFFPIYFYLMCTRFPLISPESQISQTNNRATPPNTRRVSQTHDLQDVKLSPFDDEPVEHSQKVDG